MGHIHTSRYVTSIESQDDVEQPLWADPIVPQDKDARDDEEDHGEQIQSPEHPDTQEITEESNMTEDDTTT